MTESTYNVLFVCTGNSARSILAEALLQQLGAGRFRAFSAGSQPRGVVHPLALRTLAEQHLPTAGLRSKSWSEFAQPGAPVLHFVFTVCDSAAGEVCPVWPGQPMTAHWGMPDPAAVGAHETGAEPGPEPGGEPGREPDFTEAQRMAFRDAFITLKRRIELMLALPMASLDRMALGRSLTDIGAR